MTVTDQEKLAGITREAVREAMAEKEEADRLSKMEELLTTATAETGALTEVLATKEEEIVSASGERDSLAAQLEELRIETEKLKDALVAASKDNEKLEERASTAEATLAGIEAEKNLAGRMAELEEAKVIKAEDKRTAQEDKVRGLSEEEFATYKEELVDFRTEWEAEKAVAEKEAASKEQADEKAEAVADAEKEKAQKEEASAAAAAALNIEVASESTLKKYLSWGKQLADDMKNSQE